MAAPHTAASKSIQVPFSDANGPGSSPSAGVFLLNSAGEILQASPDAALFLGIDASRLQGRRLSSAILELRGLDDAVLPESHYPHTVALRESKIVSERYLRLLRADGFTALFAISCIPLPHSGAVAAACTWVGMERDEVPSLVLRLADFLDKASLGFFWSSSSGKPLFSNTRFLALFGASSLAELLGGPGGPPLERALAKTPTPRHPFGSFSTQLTRHDGGQLAVNITQVLFETDLFSISGIAALVVDNSERTTMVQDLRKSQRTLEEFMRHLPAMAFIKDQNGHNIFVNRNIQESLGKTEDECRGRTSVEIFEGIDAKMVARSDEEVLKTRAPVVNEMIVRNPKWTKTFHTLKFPIELDEGQVLFGGMAVDITDRKEHEARLIENEAKYRLIFEKAGDAIVVLDEKGLIVSANPMAYRQYEYKPDALLGLHVSSLDTPEQAVEAQHRIDQVLTGGSLKFLTRHQKTNGQSFDVEVNARRFRWREKVGILCLFRDLTLAKQAEDARLIRSKLESTGVLAGGIAHDFNNLLTTILLSVEMTQLSLKEQSTQQAELLGTAVDAVHAAQELSKRLITFADGGAPIFGTVDLSKLVADSVKPLIDETKTRVVLDFEKESLVAQADPGQVAQLLQNLIMNANEAMPLGGLLTLRLKRLPSLTPTEPDTSEIMVEDNGVGIPSEVLSRIYDPYFSTKVRGEQKGMGLGLTICRSIALQHHGSIGVESKIGSGTKVRILLPLRQKQKNSNDGRALTSEIKPIRRILVMDDDEFMRRVLDRTLKFFGYECALASRGEEALSMAKEAATHQAPFDLFMLDLMVKDGMGAMDTIKELKLQWPDAKVLVMSGYADNDALTNFAAHGFCGSLSKPFTNQQLRQLLKEVSGQT